MQTDIWNKVLESLGHSINKQSFETWLKDTKLLTISENTMKIKVADDVAGRHISENYSAQINKMIEHFSGKSYTCEYITENDYEKSETLQTNVYPVISEKSKNILNPKYTFDNYVIGPNNQLASAAASAVSKSPAKQYNPLFIYGGSGLGKTHLIQAIGNSLINEKPYLKVLYIPTGEFVNEFIFAIRTNTTPSFKIKYTNSDVLLIDDIQNLEDKIETQNEFFFIFNHLYLNNKQIVLTSDRPPRQIATLADRLKTRFEGGLICDIQPPTLETREAILRNKAEKENIDISDDVLIYIAKRIKSNIRALEAALNRLKIVNTLYNEPVTLVSVKSHLKDLFDDDSMKKITVNDVIKKVSEKYNISPEEIVSKTRHSRVILPRFAAMYITRNILGMTTIEIGKNFGDRDHSTVVNAINKIEEDLKNDYEFKETIDGIIDEIKS